MDCSDRSTPESITIGWPDLLMAQVSGLPKAEYTGAASFARTRFSEGSPLIILHSERHGLLTFKPTFSNDPAAFVVTVRAITAGLIADSTRKFEAKIAAKQQESKDQQEIEHAVGKAQRYFHEKFVAAVRCRLVLSGGELPGYTMLFEDILCFFDHADIAAEDREGRPIVRYLGQTESCEVRTPGGVMLNGQGVPSYSASASPDSDIHFRMSFGDGQDLNLRVPYASLSPVQQQDCAKSLNEFLQALARTYDGWDEFS